jgi:hypothetical protein
MRKMRRSDPIRVIRANEGSFAENQGSIFLDDWENKALKTRKPHNFLVKEIQFTENLTLYYFN